MGSMKSIKVLHERLDEKKVNQYIFAKQGVLPGFQDVSIANVARKHCGLHSARLPTAYVTLHSRLTQYQTIMLWEELFEQRKLIKLRCMRKTLHIVPLDLAPIVHSATLEMRIGDCTRFYEKNNVSVGLIEKIKDTLLDYVRDEPKSSGELLRVVIKSVSNGPDIISNDLVRVVIKELWEKGKLCYINQSNQWDKESRAYGRTESYYPNLDLDKFSVQEARERLFYYYIENFGPVSIKDMSWWSGLSMRIVRESIASLKDNLISLYYGDNDVEVFMTLSDYENYLSFNENEKDWIRLLAYEDPSLKGYYETRFRYVDSKHYENLFNQIGEVRASIILNGKVVGIWAWNKRNKDIDLTFFEDLQPEYNDMLQKETYSMISCLNAGLVQYKLIND